MLLTTRAAGLPEHTWITMPPKRASTELEETVLKRGCLTKSPPSYIFSKRASWKGRLLKLCKTPLDTYYIRYYAYNGVTEDWKGDIAVHDIKSIEVGSNTMEKVMTITRLFNNSPENILCIKTSKRDYYLVDDKIQNIRDWQKAITDVWVKINQGDNVDGPRIAHLNTISPSSISLPMDLSQDEAQRPKSYPDETLRSGSVLLDTEERQRSHTDPETRRGILSGKPKDLFFDNVSDKLELPELTRERKRSKTHSDAMTTVNPIMNNFRRFSLTDQSEKDLDRLSGDTAYNSDQESIYDVPRRVSRGASVPEDSPEEGDSDSDNPDHNVYQRMGSFWSLDSENNNTDSTDQTEIPPELPKRLCNEEQNIPMKPPRIPKATHPNRYQKSQLNRAYILKMMYEDGSAEVELHLTVPTAHLQNHLKLQEVGERLCVSQWRGPAEIGCVFCHGDHIEDINGFRPENKEFFFQMLQRSTKDEVNLVVIRKKKAEVFHVEGCNCGGS